MDSIELFVLGLSVLNHEPDTHKILADVLEEQGELGMAQWARSRKSSRVKRLDFVLAVLPTKLALRVACSFAVRALELGPAEPSRNRYLAAREPRSTEMIQLIINLRSLVKEGVNTDALVAPLFEWSQKTYLGSKMEEVELMLALQSAAVLLLRIDECRSANDYRGERKQVTECRNAVRSVGKLARQIVEKYELRVTRRTRGATLNRTELANYLNWQYEHLQNFLTELIEKPSE